MILKNMKNILAIILLHSIFFSINGCNKYSDDFKTGTYHLYNGKELNTVITRNEHYQMEEFMEDGSVSMYHIEWINERKYILKPINDIDSIRDMILTVTVDSIIDNDYYLTSRLEGVEMELSNKLVKINNGLKKGFLEETQKIDSVIR